jgi:mRNA interferase MazF
MGEGGSTVNLGDIYWVEFPSTNGHEQAGRRPAIILQEESMGGGLPVAFAIPLTSSLKALRFSGTVRIDPSSENRLTQPSVALVFQLRAVDRRRFGELVGTISQEHLAAIFIMLDNLTGRKQILP